MLEEQNGECFICGSKPDDQLHIDHDHKTGKVRKLLCRSCNAALGMCKESIDILKKIIEYIKLHD